VNGLFVTGTDTGVGKTVVTAALARSLRARGASVAVSKPVQSGAAADDPAGDAMTLRRAAGVDDPPEAVCPHAFAAPLAPLVAARLEGRRVELADAVRAVESVARGRDVVLVEGAGGLLVPAGEGWTVADLAAALELRLLVVARAGLGTVNHTLLTVEAARRRGLDVAGVVLNGRGPETDGSVDTNPELIETWGDVRVLAVLPAVGENGAGEPDAALAARRELEPLVALLEREEAVRGGRT
jgi:dethiobiotin synthetase